MCFVQFLVLFSFAFLSFFLLFSFFKPLILTITIVFLAGASASKRLRRVRSSKFWWKALPSDSRVQSWKWSLTLFPSCFRQGEGERRELSLASAVEVCFRLWRDKNYYYCLYMSVCASLFKLSSAYRWRIDSNDVYIYICKYQLIWYGNLQN